MAGQKRRRGVVLELLGGMESHQVRMVDELMPVLCLPVLQRRRVHGVEGVEVVVAVLVGEGVDLTPHVLAHQGLGSNVCVCFACEESVYAPSRGRAQIITAAATATATGTTCPMCPVHDVWPYTHTTHLSGVRSRLRQRVGVVLRYGKQEPISCRGKVNVHLRVCLLHPNGREHVR